MARGDIFTYQVAGKSSTGQSLSVTPPTGKVYKVLNVAGWRDRYNKPSSYLPHFYVGINRDSGATIYLYYDSRGDATTDYFKHIFMGGNGQFSDSNGAESCAEIILTDRDTLRVQTDTSDLSTSDYSIYITVIEV